MPPVPYRNGVLFRATGDRGLSGRHGPSVMSRGMPGSPAGSAVFPAGHTGSPDRDSAIPEHGRRNDRRRPLPCPDTTRASGEPSRQTLRYCPPFLTFPFHASFRKPFPAIRPSRLPPFSRLSCRHRRKKRLLSMRALRLSRRELPQKPFFREISGPTGRPERDFPVAGGRKSLRILPPPVKTAAGTAIIFTMTFSGKPPLSKPSSRLPRI